MQRHVELHYLIFLSSRHSHSWYDYHGECDLVLVAAPKLDMDIHGAFMMVCCFYDPQLVETNALTSFMLHTTVRTQFRWGFSYIESDAVRLGDDVLE